MLPAKYARYTTGSILYLEGMVVSEATLPHVAFVQLASGKVFLAPTQGRLILIRQEGETEHWAYLKPRGLSSCLLRSNTLVCEVNLSEIPADLALRIRELAKETDVCDRWQSLKEDEGRQSPAYWFESLPMR